MFIKQTQLLLHSLLLSSSIFFLTLNSPAMTQANIPLANSFSCYPFFLIKNRVILPKALQNELEIEITQAQKELNRLTETFSLKFNQEIGIVYFHKGGDRWKINFTFGNVVLNIQKEIVLSSSDIFQLKDCFRKTEQIVINGKLYTTTQSMQQLGPMLHK